MKKKQLGILMSLSIVLAGCSVSAESATSTTIESNTKTIDEFHYDGSKTTIAKKKDESVTVEADASGNPEKITVDTKLSSIEGNEVVEDISELKDINNSKGDEQFEEKDGKIYWENLGHTISYSGTTTKELPVNVKVTYYLNDEKIDPESLAGKSGNVKIRFDYANNTKYEELHVPFICMTALILSNDDFSDIEVKNGKVSEMDDSSIILGYAAPSLKQDLNVSAYDGLEDIDIPEYVEVTATTTNFELDFTETIITKGIFSEIEDDDLNDLSEVTDNFKELGDSGDKLSEAGNTLTSSFGKLQSGVSAYLDGVEQVSSGVQQLSDGSNQLNDNTSQLVEGAKALSDALNSVDLSSSDEETQETLKAIQTDLQTIGGVAQSLGDLSKAVTDLKTSVDTALGGSDSKTDIDTSFDSINTTITTLATSLTTTLQDLTKQMSSLSGEGLGDMPAQFDKLKEVAKAVSDGSSALADGVSKLNEGIGTLNDGVQSATQNNETLKNAFSAYSSGLSEFSNAINKLNTEGLQKMSEKGNEYSGLINKIEKLKKAEESYQSFMPLLDGQEGSVSFMIETAKISN